MTIIPATMFLLGERAWTIPAWLDKMLPKVDIEGESLTDDAIGRGNANGSSNTNAEAEAEADPAETSHSHSV